MQRYWKELFIFAMLIAASTTQIHAQDLTHKWGVGGAFGINYPQQSNFFQENYDQDKFFEAHLLYHYSPRLASILELSHETFDATNAAGTFNGAQTLLGGVFYRIGNPVSPWISGFKLGVGAARLDDDRGSKIRVAAALGFSMAYLFQEKWSLGLGIDYKYFDAYNNGFSEFKTITPMAMVTYYFDGEKRRDSDQDGVSDSVDQCANTPARTKVDAKGCAVAEEDDDNDKVDNAKDKCPNSPQDEKVDANGCALSQKDSDRDGISDLRDHCPDTKVGTKVNSTGCADNQKVEVEVNIQFATNSSEIEAKYFDELQKVALFLKNYPDTKGVIEGHTDAQGNPKANQKLSSERAQKVRDYIVTKFGVDASRLTAKGFGSSKPVANNKTEAGRSENRRVIAVFKGK
ncbi:MAG: OmpA family protein [Bacteriovoracaceae bacterium]|nr:OmpA family protein [Bacteriovoracaceae bacterium]